jgi:hypothetical protein
MRPLRASDQASDQAGDRAGGRVDRKACEKNAPARWITLCSGKIARRLKSLIDI